MHIDSPLPGQRPCLCGGERNGVVGNFGCYHFLMSSIISPVLVSKLLSITFCTPPH
jgi:hypothetical protein